MPMPKRPKVRKRTAAVIGNAVKVMRIATGEEEEDFPANDGKDAAAKSLCAARQSGARQGIDAKAARRDCKDISS